MRTSLRYILFSLGMVVAMLVAAENTIPDLYRGASFFYFQCSGKFEGTKIKVYYYIPMEGDVRNMKVQFVMHGVNRNADSYCESWQSKAEQYGLIILAPMFDKKNFPTEMYQQGNVCSNGTLNYDDELTYSQIDAIFKAFMQKYDIADKTYNIYGHSAGAQFVHRMVLFYDSPYLDKAVAANAGTYTFVSSRQDYPYGLRNIGGPSSISKKVFQKQLIVFLAEGDTIRDPHLNVSSEADRQGTTRFERGNNFFRSAEDYATKKKRPFLWQLRTLSGAAHSNRQMAPAAADLLYAKPD